MKEISSLYHLKSELKSNENVWLLLYKKGSEQSDCALANFAQAGKNSKKGVLCFADVNNVRDIHTVYQVTTVPSLIHFEKESMKNVSKGCFTPEQFNAIFEKNAYKAANGEGKKARQNVTVYTTPTCSWCTTIKRHLQENGISYREVNVAADAKAAEEMVKKSGQQGVPQTEINGQIIVGFDKIRINNLLGIN